jgi:uncharacterized membrane protein
METGRHLRFYIALGAGLAAGAATGTFGTPIRLLLGGDVFFLSYLGLTAGYVAEPPRRTCASVRRGPTRACR